MVTHAFVLSGGGAAGDFEVGAVRLLLQRGLQPAILIGTSVGAINATKLAEGEGSPTQGFAGLLEVWLSLRGNQDMWAPAFWLANLPDGVRRPLMNGLQPKLRAPRDLGDIMDFIEDDLPRIITSLDELTRARSLANLDPIASRFGALLDEAKVRASGRKLRLGTVSLETGRMRFVTEAGELVERDQQTRVGTMAGAPPPRAEELRAELVALAATLRELRAELRAQGASDDLLQRIRDTGATIAARRGELAALLAAVPRVPLAVALPAGILASSSIAVLFPPVQLGDEHYVDGGHRDQVSADAAARLGATDIFVIVAAPPSLDAPSPDRPHPQPESFADKGLLEIGVRAALAIHLNEMEATDLLRPAGFTGGFTVIAPVVALHDVLTIDPGLIRQNIGYGYMRAADVLDGVGPDVAATADEILILRAQMWRKECELFGRPVPTDPAASSTVPVLARHDELLADAARLRGLVADRAQRGGALPPEASRWGHGWEDHPWEAACLGPLTAICPAADTIEVFGRALDGRTLTATWSPGPQWRGALGVAHGHGLPTGWVEAVATGGEVHAFAIGADGGVHRSVRAQAGRTWSPWWPVGATNQGSARTRLDAPVHAISRAPGEVELFWANGAGVVLTVRGTPTTGWSQPRELAGAKTAAGGHVTAISSGPGRLDLFMIGLDGGVVTTRLTAGSTWGPWTRIGGEVGVPGAYVAAVVRRPDFLDVFFADVNGNVLSAAHDPSSAAWKGWWWIQAGKTTPGAYVTAVSPAPDKLSIFCVGLDGRIATAWWGPGVPWTGWLPVGAAAAPGRPVWAVSRRTDQIDLVYSTAGNTIETAGCEAPGLPFAGPWQIAARWQPDDLG